MGSRFIIILLALFTILTFQNCSKGFRTGDTANRSSAFTPKSVMPGLSIEGRWRGVLIGNTDPVVLEIQFQPDLSYAYSIAGSGYSGAGSGHYSFSENGVLSCNNTFVALHAANSRLFTVANAQVEQTAGGLAFPIHFVKTDLTPLYTLGLYLRKAEPVPSLGLMSNDDGDNAFQSPDPAQNERLVRKYMTQLADAHVESLQFNVAAGVLYYPTQVGSRYAWKLSAQNAGRLDCSKWKNACESAFGAANCEDQTTWERACWAHNIFNAGTDPVRTAAETFLSESRARGKNPRFFVSYRISDDHFIDAPASYPLITKFWLEHQNRLTIKASGKAAPVPNRNGLDNMLNFQHAEVREQILGEIREAFTRYADVSSGIELDFTRTPYLFPAGEGAASSAHITDLVRRVRRLTVAFENQYKKPVYLIVRVPPTIENSMWAGLDVSEWIRGEMADVVIPSHIMLLNADMPVQDFKALARGTNVKIYAGMPNRQNMNYELTGSAAFAGGARTAGCYTGVCGLHAAPLPAVIKGAALNLRLNGADGLQLYNFAAPSYLAAPWFIELTRELAGTGSSSVRTEYAIAQPTAADWEGRHEPVAQLPAIIGQGPALSRFKIQIAGSPAAQGGSPLLRLGLFRQTYAKSISVVINGRSVLHNALVSSVIHPTAVANDASLELERNRLVYLTAPGSYLHIPVPAEGVLKAGENVVEIYFEEPTSLLDLRIGFIE